MALKKDITLDNGILLTYHRVVSINSIINHQSLIEVGSYINEEQRNKEKEWYTGNCEDDLNVFISTVYYPIEYNKELNVDNAYEYLKTLDVFADAEDILEESTTEEVVEETNDTETEEEIVEETVIEEIIPEENVQEETIEEEVIPQESTEVETETTLEETVQEGATEEEIIPEESTNNEE